MSSTDEKANSEEDSGSSDEHPVIRPYSYFSRSATVIESNGTKFNKPDKFESHVKAGNGSIAKESVQRESSGNGIDHQKVENPANDNSEIDDVTGITEHAVMCGQLNPIFIPCIINHLVSFLGCSDLKRCRLINKAWNEECQKFLRQKGLIRLTSSSRIEHFTSQFQTKTRFCENFYFEAVKGVETDNFFDTFGPFIKYFKLDFSKSTGYHLTADEFHNLLFRKLPNLQELSMVGCISGNDHFLPEDKRVPPNTDEINVPNNGDSQVVPRLPQPPTLPLLKRLEIFLYSSTGMNVSKHEFLIELLSCVPNMEKISVPKEPRMLSFGMPLLHTLITTHELCFKRLQHLDMDIALYNGSIDILKSKGYPLKYLNAEINSTVSRESLQSFLETYGKTLKGLQLKFPRSPLAPSVFKSSTFHVLQHLTLNGYEGSLKFVEGLRFLQTFGLIDNAFSKAMRRQDFNHPLRAQFSYKMIWTDWHEEAYCYDSMNSSDAQLLEMFSRNFLNLTSLNLPYLNDHDLRIIYLKFAHSLQELTMENSLCSDYGVTGISHEIFSDVVDMGKLENYRTQPFIGNLKRLRRLEILTPSIHITDDSIKYGIVNCENLKVIVIRNAPITDNGLRKLVDFMCLEHLETTMCANIRGAAVKYAIGKMKTRQMTFIWNKYQSRMTVSFIDRCLNGNNPVTCLVHTE